MQSLNIILSNYAIVITDNVGESWKIMVLGVSHLDLESLPITGFVTLNVLIDSSQS